MSVWTSLATWVNGAVTAATMNVEVRDHLAWLKGAFTQLGVTSDVAQSNLGRGNTFPASPQLYDRYFWTDQGLEFYWDGVHWLSTTVYNDPVAISATLQPYSATAAERYAPAWRNIYDVWLLAFYATFIVVGGTALDGSNYWRITLYGEPSHRLYLDYYIATGASDIWRDNGPGWIDALQDSVDPMLQLNYTKVGTPGNLYISPRVAYRLVAYLGG